MHKIPIVLFSLLLLLSCTNSPTHTKEINIIAKANKIARVLKSKDQQKISTVCTKQGFNSLLDWTDSLKNDKLLNVITTKLASNTFAYSIASNQHYRISIEPEEMNDGNHVGDITLIIRHNKALLEQYAGGVLMD